ncbi:hypothetical protein Tco_1031445 [Tanacetum coccineum]|uniref:Gag-Pol polyprotein n=1 Tax=Tanacetum coccineum TaxID=301880 RepID=A0ABQ5G995_9ASTR
MAAGSKDRPPMLGPGRYSQWRSRFLRVTSLNVQIVKTNQYWEFGKFTSRDGESMESYYSRFYKLMNELTRNNLQVTLMQVNVQFLQQLQPEWSRFVTLVKQSKKIDITYHRLFDILKQFQKEVNDIRAERIAKSANPLATTAALRQPYSEYYYQAPNLKGSNATFTSTRQSAYTRHNVQRVAKQLHLILSLSLKKTVESRKAQREQGKCKRIWHSLQSTFKSSTKPNQQQPSNTSSNSQEQD